MKYLVLFFFLITSLAAASQDTSYLHSFNKSRMQKTRTAMFVLGSWGVANLATGLIGNSTAGGEARYFHQMNAVWGAVNLGIATASILGSRKLHPGKYNWQGSVQEQHKVEKIFMVNGALDLAYMAGGLYLREHGKRKLTGKSHDRFKGYGNSLLMQGAFLLLFDGVNFAIHHSHGKGLFERFGELQLTVAPGGMGMVYQW
ncbi:DUF6992 family protein [Chitinophaga rhizophila]|uniref:Uncharacterized protein n=1 Tax=Chitinophaga rhizophila TaxID=2866212 RepID=A0ABS7GK45_9BACT|nr:hypothetical protein [Chitinophaga rhizophila]MBW8688090.1 hypothetical protein [Chitinophaga rhizophila]